MLSLGIKQLMENVSHIWTPVRGLSFCLAALVWLPFAAMGQESTELKPGGEVAVPIPQSDGTMKVYLPSNYTPDRKWPAIFFYPGIDDIPTTELIRNHTGGRDYIVVGLPFVKQAQQPRNPTEHSQYLQRELNAFRAARTWLDQKASVDQNRVFMGGVTKGGWMAVALSDREFGKLAGIIILLAGRQRTTLAPPSKDVVTGKRIYIGSVETGGYPLVALQGREFYRRYGAVVTYEEYPGGGHNAPQLAPLLKAWLDAIGPYATGMDKETQAKLSGEFHAFSKKAKETQDLVARYRSLLQLAENPLLAMCDKELATETSAQISALRNQSPVKEEWAAEQLFTKFAWSDLHVRTLKDMKEVADGLQSTKTTYPNTRYGEYAARLGEGVSKAYEKSVAASKQRGGR